MGMEQPAKRTPRLKKRWWLGALLLAVGGYVWSVRDNFGTVLPGVLYRSAQPGAADLVRYAARHGIRSVINLRGHNPDEAWYQEELAASARLGLRHYDLSTDSLFPTSDELPALIALLQECEKPVLVHCKSGIDRSGAAAVLGVLVLADSGSVLQARRQMGLRFCQMPWFVSWGAQDLFLCNYEQWLQHRGVEHSPAQFRDWALHVYDGKATFPEPR